MSVRVMAQVFDRYPNGGGEMLLALALADHASDDGTNIWPRVASLAEKTRQSARTVQYQLRRMEAFGWLQMVSVGNGGRSQTTEYRINPMWLGGVEFDDLLPAEPEPTDIGNVVELPKKEAEKAEKMGLKRVQSGAERVQSDAKRVQTATQKGANHDTKGCNLTHKRVQPVAPAKNHQEPSRNHQGTAHELVNELTAPPKIPDPPVEQIIAAYHVALPDLPQVIVVGQRRERAIKRFWRWVLTSKKRDGTPRASTVNEGMAWVQGYFERAAKNDFIMGRLPRGRGHEGWEANIDFLLQENAIAMVIERTARLKVAA